MTDLPAESLDESPGYFELIRSNPNFRNLWLGQIVSLFGDWFNLIASAALVGSLSESGLAVGALFVVRMLAPFLVSPLAGVAADRYNRKFLLLGADIVRAVVVLGFLFVRTPEDVWIVYVLTAVQLGMQGVFFPTRSAILPDIVKPSEIGTANTLSAVTWSTMAAFGAATGGLVAGAWGIYPSFVIDSATFLLSAVFIARVAYRPRRSDGSRRMADAAREYVDGLRYLVERPRVGFGALQKASLGLFVAGAYEVIQVPIATESFVIGKGGGISLGLMYAALGVGSGLGPILARRVTGDRDGPLRVAILCAYGAMAIGLAISSTLVSLPLVLTGTLIRAMGGGTIWVFSTQLLLQTVPERVRGRVFATEFALLTLAMAISAGLAGWALDNPGWHAGSLLRLMAMMLVLPAGLWASFGRRGAVEPA